jgi:hypothetical protein
LAEVSFWHKCEVSERLLHVGYRGKTGRYLLIASFSHFDPTGTLAA